jgi:hypothetical protein
MKKDAALYRRIREILESARVGLARTVNSAQVAGSWLIGREIVEEEQRGSMRAGYGKELHHGNLLGARSGHWAFTEFTEVYQIEADFKATVETEFDKMIAKTIQS